MCDNVEIAGQFLKSCGVAVKTKRFPFGKGDETQVVKYIITRKGKQLSGEYLTASDDEHEPTVYEILSGLPNREPETDLFVFAKRHGYEISCQREYDEVSEIYKTYCRNWRGIKKLFGDVFDEFLEIFKEVSDREQ